MTIFTKFLPFVGSLMFGYVLKFRRIRFRGLGLYGGLSLGVCKLPQIVSAL